MVSQDIKHLFDEYAAAYNRLDAAAIPAFYAEWAMAAAPNFVGCTQNNEALLAAIEQAYAFYQSIGMCSAEILALDETTLDEHPEIGSIWPTGWSPPTIRSPPSRPSSTTAPSSVNVLIWTG